MKVPDEAVLGETRCQRREKSQLEFPRDSRAARKRSKANRSGVRQRLHLAAEEAWDEVAGCAQAKFFQGKRKKIRSTEAGVRVAPGERVKPGGSRETLATQIYFRGVWKAGSRRLSCVS